jgi:hypothetical protein
MQKKLLGIVSEDFDGAGQPLIIHSAFIKYMRKAGNTNKLFIDFKIAYDSFRREGLCNILIEFGIPIKLVRLITMRLNEIYSRLSRQAFVGYVFYYKWFEIRRKFNAIAFQLCFRERY